MIQIIDVTDDERFYIQGHFPTLEAANTAIDEYVAQNNGAPPADEQTDLEFGVVLELTQLRMGWGDPIKLQRREWELTGVVDEGSGIEEWRELHPSEFG